jgi:hypothetical protein
LWLRRELGIQTFEFGAFLLSLAGSFGLCISASEVKVYRRTSGCETTGSFQFRDSRRDVAGLEITTAE